MVSSNVLESLIPDCLFNEHFVDKLIRLYRANECLWNPKTSGYYNLALKENAWHRIAHIFKDELTVDQLKFAITSMRNFYERERSRQSAHFIPAPETIYQKLQFLELTEMENDNEMSIEAKPKICNSQINCIAVNTILLNNSQNCIQSEHVEFGLPFALDEDHPAIETMALSERKSSVNFPFSLMEYQNKDLQVRALSGSDRIYSKSNYNCEDKYDDCRRKQSRSHSTSSKAERRHSNYSDISQNDMCDYNHATCSDCSRPQASKQPKKKVLTGRYSKRSSRQRLQDNMYETQFNETHNYRKTSGNDEENLGRNNNPNSYPTCSGPPECICCPSSRRKYQNQSQQNYYEDDQVNYQDETGNQSQVPPESEYMDTVPEESQPHNDDDFQSPEPTSEDYASQVATRKCCRNDSCPQKQRKLKSPPYDRQQWKDKPYEEYDDLSDQSTQPRQLDGNDLANESRPGSLPISEKNFERDQQAVLVNQSRRGSHSTSKSPSRNESKNVSGATSPVQSVSRPPAQEPKIRYCARNLNQTDESYKEKFVECPNLNRRYRRRQEEEPTDGHDFRERANIYRNEYEDDQNGSKRSSGQRKSDQNRQIVIRSSGQRESSRCNSESYEYDDLNSRRRQQSDQSEKYTVRKRQDQYDNDQYCECPETRSRSYSQRDQPEKYSARRSTQSNQRKYIIDEDIRYENDNTNDGRQGSDKLRNYEIRKAKYQEEANAYQMDADSCICLSDDNESINRPDYAGQTVEGYPRTYDDDPRVKYNQDYADESLDEYPHGFAEETRNGYPSHRYAEDYDNDYPDENSQQRSRKDRTKDICEEYSNDDYDTEYVERTPKGRARDLCKECCAGIAKQISDDYPRDDEDNSQNYAETRKISKDENADFDSAKKGKPCYCEAAVETEIDMTLNNRKGASQSSNKDNQINASPSQPKPIKTVKKTKAACKCIPQALNKPKTGGRSPSPAQNIPKQRSAPPTSGSKFRRPQNLENDVDNSKFQAYGGHQGTRFCRLTEEPRPHNRKLYRQRSGFETNPSYAPKHQLVRPIDGMAVLGTFQVPPTLAEKTINIVQNHISNMTPLPTNNFTREMKKLRKVQDKSVRSVSYTEVTRKINSPGKVKSNPFRNINFDAPKEKVIILHPPVQDFHPSKYSCSLNEVEIQQSQNVKRSMKTMPPLPKKPTSKLTS